jgi:hypothetical protein
VVGPKIQNKLPWFRKAISVQIKLEIILHYIASGTIYYLYSMLTVFIACSHCAVLPLATTYHSCGICNVLIKLIFLFSATDIATYVRFCMSYISYETLRLFNHTSLDFYKALLPAQLFVYSIIQYTS